MRVGLIVENKQTKNGILSAHTKADVLFKQIGKFDQLKISEHFEAAARLHIDVLYVSLESIMEENSFVRSLRQYRINRPTTKVVIIAVDKLAGDPTLNSIVNIGIYDIIAPSTEGLEEDEEIDLTHYVSYCLDHPGTYATAARWSVGDNVESERVVRRPLFNLRNEKNDQDQLNKHEVETKEVVVYRDRFYGSVVIGFTGNYRRTGNTYSAIKAAQFFAKQNYKVAYVEFTHQENSVISHFKNEESSKVSPGGFHYKGVDYFPKANLNKLINLYSAPYKYVVVDYDFFLEDEAKDELSDYAMEYVRSDLHIVTSGSAMWDLNYLIKTLDKFFLWEWTTTWRVLFNYTTDKMLKNFKNIFSKKEMKELQLLFYRADFNPELFSLTEYEETMYAKLFESILENKSARRFGLSFMKK